MDRPSKPISKALRSAVRLPKPVHLAIYLVGGGVWITGLLWLLLDQFVVRNGEFGPEKSPLEPWSLKVHGTLAMGTVFLFGLLWGIHIQTAWPVRRRRRSGVTLIGWLILLVISGYLLYYVASEYARQAISIAHWVSGLLLPLFYGLHRLKRRRMRSHQ